MFRRTKVCAAVALAFAGVAPVSAQQLERVEVTGSSIKRIDAETAVPVTVLRMDQLKSQGITTVEQVLASVSSMQASQGTSQVVGLGTGGASFADLRALGFNKTLVLLNGRRLANNAFDSSAPDLNMIPFAALERVEVLRDGASSLYGSDAIGGVINFITRNDFGGLTITAGIDVPKSKGGKSKSGNIGFGWGDLEKDGYNIFGFIDRQFQDRIGGTQRPFNKRYAGGLSPTTNPANYFQAGDSGNPTAPSCAAGTNLIPNDTGLGCQMTTSSFVDYVPESSRTSGLLKGTRKLSADHQLGLEAFFSRSLIQSQIAPVPYGALRQNPFLADGTTPNPYYPGNAGAPFTPNITLDPAFDNGGAPPAGTQPGYINVKWRDLPNGPRADHNFNQQQRYVASLSGLLGGWDYEAAVSYNENKVTENLSGYSDGGMIRAGVLNGVINPFGPQSAAGTALITAAALDGNIQNAKGTTFGIDAHASSEVGDWLGAGRQAALAVGVELQRQKFTSAANPDYAAKVVSSTGIDPATFNQGARTVAATFVELNLPIIKQLEVTGSLRYDNYSDFGSTVNPKVSFRFQPQAQVLVRGSASTGFRAPSLFDINSAQAYTNTTQQNDPVNCPGGVVAPGKTAAISCDAQFMSLTGGNKDLKPEKAKNAALGLLFEPVAGMSLGVDLWWVRLSKKIDTLAQDDVFGPNFATLYASVYHRNPQGNLATDGSECPDPTTCGYVDLRTLNLGGVNTNGADITASYRLRTELGQFGFGLSSSYVIKNEYQNVEGGEWHQNVGVYSGTKPVFRWQHNPSVNWSGTELSAGIAAHYKSGYVDSPADAADNGVPGFRVASYTTFDVYGSWSPSKGVSMLFGVRNLFDRSPPLSYQTETFQAGYDPRYSDPTGRTYYLRGSYTF
jgi:iron complex outermembrane receptor protein